MRRDPFRGHRFPRSDILLAVRWYCRFPLWYQDVADLLAERGVTVDRATVFRRVQKFGPEIAKRAYAHRGWRGLTWHVDETYVRVGGRWRYLWRAVDQKGQFIVVRLTARRDAKAARAFLKQAIDGVRLYRPVSICTDKAPGYRKVIRDLNHRYAPHTGSILHIDRTWRSSSSDEPYRERSCGAEAPAGHTAIVPLVTIRQGDTDDGRGNPDHQERPCLERRVGGPRRDRLCPESVR